MNTQLRNMRKERRLTQVRVAKIVNISEISYQRIEYGIQRPNLDTAILIAHALNSTVKELFGSATTIDEKPGGNLPTDSTPCRVI